MSNIRVSPGERYYDRQHDEELTALDASPRLDQLLIEIEGGAQEIRSLSDFLKRLRCGDIVEVEAQHYRLKTAAREIKQGAHAKDTAPGAGLNRATRCR